VRGILCSPVYMGTAYSGRTRPAPARALDELVWQDLCQILTQPALIIHELQRAHRGEWLPQALQARRKTLREALAQLERQHARLLEVYLAEIIEREAFERKRQEVTQTQHSLTQQLRPFEAQAQQQVEVAALAQRIKAFCQRIHPTLAQLAFAQRRQLVELLIDRVIVMDDQVEIRYVVPTGPKGETTPFCHWRLDYLHGPTFVIRPDDVRGRELGGIGHQPEDLAGRALAREDHVERAPVADLQPPGLDIAVADAAVGLGDDQGVGAPPLKEVFAIPPRFQLSAQLKEPAMALEGGGHVKVWRATGLPYGVAEIVGITQDHDLNTGGGLALPDELGRQLGGLVKREIQSRTPFFFDVEPDAKGNHMLVEEQNATDIPMAPAVGLGHGVFQLGNGVYDGSLLSFLRSIDDQIDGFSWLWMERREQFPRLLAQSRGGLPPRATKKKLLKRLRWCWASRYRYRLATWHRPHMQAMARTNKRK
jgi:hypothetical protein